MEEQTLPPSGVTGLDAEASSSRRLPSKVRSLKLLDLGSEETRAARIPLDPEVSHGVLENGVTYYIRKNCKPKERASIALVVNVGSVAEEEHERGVAHILEHLAFSATAKYSNHDIVKFLESIGAEFGACQNAHTSADETVFELTVPVDKPGLLPTSLSVLAEFASEIRASEEDLRKERGAVLEEWRERRDAKGRMQEAHWKLLLQGSKYAERLPIGLEQVIRTVPASAVRAFYRRWYRPRNMAVVAVGDFEQSVEEVRAMIAEHFGHIQEADSAAADGPADEMHGPEEEREALANGEREGPEGEAVHGADGRRSPAPDADGGAHGQRGSPSPSAGPHGVAADGPGDGLLPANGPAAGLSAEAVAVAAAAGSAPGVPAGEFVAHREPRFSVMVEREAEGSAVLISCKQPAAPVGTAAQYREHLVEELFHLALNQRLFSVSRSPAPPFYSAASASEPLVRTTRSLSLQAACQDRGTLAALESVWSELMRVRLHGFSDREVARARVQYLAELESALVEKEQTYSESLREECVEHFLRGEAMPGIEYEARLAKTLLPEITAAEVSAVGRRYAVQENCVVEIVEPRANATVEGMKRVLAQVAEAAESGQIGPWEEEALPEHLVEVMPQPGSVVEERDFPDIGATEVVLSNGMRVCYKCTDFLDDQVLISGYAYGGLAEVPKEEYYSCAMAQTVAEEVGVFGHKPTVLAELLAGTLVELAPRISTFMRSFGGEASPQDLETALQLVYQLFASIPRATPQHMQLIMQMTRELIRARWRDPASAFAARITELNYGSSRFFKPIGLSDLRKVNPVTACAYFDQCFQDPASFTVVIVGNMAPDTARPLILKYLGGIPRPASGHPPGTPADRPPVPRFRMDFRREELSDVPFQFPLRTVREEVRQVMVAEQGTTQVSFPVELAPGGAEVVDETLRLSFACRLLETQILRRLRFKHGHVYSVSVSPLLGRSRPTKDGGPKGDVAVGFSCDPYSSSALVDMVLEEVQRIQESGPSEEDVATVVELERRAHETGLHENSFWLASLLRAYQSRTYDGDVHQSYVAQEGARQRVIAELSPKSVSALLGRVLPRPCSARYTAVSLVPLAPLWRRLLSLPPKSRPGLTPESKVLLAAAAISLSALALWNWARRPDAR